MPYIHIQVSGEQDDALARRIAETASSLTADTLGKDPALTAVIVEFVPASGWFVGGRCLTEWPQRSFHWQVSITDETNTKTEKSRYLAEVHRAMAELLGGVVEHSYVHVLDARAAAYGYGGRTQESRYQRAN